MIDYSSVKKILESKNFHSNKTTTISLSKFKNLFKREKITVEVNWEIGGYITKVELTINNTKESVFNIDNFFLNELDKIIKEDFIKVYHGTPFKESAEGITESGLKFDNNFKVVGGHLSKPIDGRVYVSKKIWNSIRYSFMQPGYLEESWSKFLTKEPFGYVFEFVINKKDLLPDEDEIGAGVYSLLKEGENLFYKKYLKNINEKLKKEVSEGNFKAFSEIGKIIEPQLSLEDKNKVLESSIAVSLNKTLKYNNHYKVLKPKEKFPFKKEEDYINYFKKQKYA